MSGIKFEYSLKIEGSRNSLLLTATATNHEAIELWISPHVIFQLGWYHLGQVITGPSPIPCIYLHQIVSASLLLIRPGQSISHTLDLSDYCNLQNAHEGHYRLTTSRIWEVYITDELMRTSGDVYNTIYLSQSVDFDL